MPRSVAPRSAPFLGFTLQARRFGFTVSLSAVPPVLRLVTWTRREAPKPYRMHGDAWRIGPLSWLRLYESLPGPRT